MLITSKNIFYHLTSKLTIVIVISYILLVVLAIIFKKKVKLILKIELRRILMTDIKISNLTFQYADKVIFQNTNFTISKETINRIDGDNGIGKTTLFHILSGNLQTEFTISPNQDFEFITTECLPFNELTGKELILLFFKLNNKKLMNLWTISKYFKN